MTDQSKPRAIVYCESQFGMMDGKTANGLIRFSEKYDIIGVIDSTKADRDSGEILDGEKNDIPIYKNLDEALTAIRFKPEFLIYGMAPPEGMFSDQERRMMLSAMQRGMNIVNGLHEFLTEDDEFVRKSRECGTEIIDIRKPKAKKELKLYSGRIMDVKCPKIAVLGTDSAIGKRTSALLLTGALRDQGIHATMVTTGQTGLIQGIKYGVALDAIPEQFISGEMENAVVEAYENENPDLIIIEGQGALSHPAYLSSCFIIRGSRPDAIIVQHAPKRRMLGDFPTIPMPDIESEIKLIESFSGSPVIGITINHENTANGEIESTIESYEKKFGIPATDVLKYDCSKMIQKIFSIFPRLSGNHDRTP